MARIDRVRSAQPRSPVGGQAELTAANARTTQQLVGTAQRAIAAFSQQRLEAKVATASASADASTAAAFRAFRAQLDERTIEVDGEAKPTDEVAEELFETQAQSLLDKATEGLAGAAKDAVESRVRARIEKERGVVSSIARRMFVERAQAEGFSAVDSLVESGDLPAAKLAVEELFQAGVISAEGQSRLTRQIETAGAQQAQDDAVNDALAGLHAAQEQGQGDQFVADFADRPAEEFDDNPQLHQFLVGKLHAANNRDRSINLRANAEAEAKRARQLGMIRSEAQLEAEAGRISEDQARALRDTLEYSPGEFEQLIRTVRKQSETANQEAAWALQMAAGIPLDPKSKDQRDFIDKQYKQIDFSDPDAPAEFAQLTRESGMVAESFRSTLRAVNAGGSVEQAVQAAQMTGILQRQAPMAMQAVSMPETTFAHELNRRIEAGMDPATAVDVVRRNTYGLDEGTKKVLEQQYRREVVGSNNRGNERALARRVDKDEQFDPSLFTLNPEITAEMQADFDLLRKDFYLLNRDDDASADLAFQALKQTWAVTEFNGGRQVMKLAPEALHHIDGVGDEWMREQFRAEVGEGGEIGADSRTLVDGSYTVFSNNELGFPEPVRRWVPEWETSPAKLRMDLEAVAETRKRKDRQRQAVKRNQLSLSAKDPDLTLNSDIDFVERAQERVNKLRESGAVDF